MNRRSWMIMLGCAALWGASYLFIEVALDDVSEGVIVFARTALGAAVLVPLGLRAGALRPLIERGRWTLALAALQVIVPFGLITFGQNHVASGMAGILVASSPLFLAVIAARYDHEERSSGWGLVGVVVGMLGVVLLFGVDLSGHLNEMLGGLMIVGAALSYAFAVLIVKHRFKGVPPVGVAASTMVLSAAAYLPYALATLPSEAPGMDTIASLAVLGAGGTGIAFLFFYTLIDRYGPAKASIVAYLAPAFAVVYGVTILGEDLGASTVAGLLLILAGSWLGAQGRLPGRVRRAGFARPAAEPAPGA